MLPYHNRETLREINLQKRVHVVKNVVFENKLATVMEYVMLVYATHMGTEVEPFHEGDFTSFKMSNEPKEYVMSKCARM